MSKLSNAYYEIKNGIRGILYWLPFAWKWRPWDYAYGLLALKHHFIKLEKCVRNGYAVDAKKTANEIKKAIILLDRVIDEKYLLNKTPECINEKYNVKMKIKQIESDWNYLFLLLRKRIRYWWD